MRIAYDVSQDWSLQANLTNVFNKEYETVNTYNSLDRMVMVRLSYQPQIKVALGSEKPSAIITIHRYGK